jgi:glucosylceramidase
LKLFGSPWGAPAWLKDNHKINNGGFLIGNPGGKQYKIFANYIVKYVFFHIIFSENIFINQMNI